MAFSIDDGDGEKLIVLAELKRNRVRQADYRSEFAAIRARLTEECGIQADRTFISSPFLKAAHYELKLLQGNYPLFLAIYSSISSGMQPTLLRLAIA